MKLRNYTSSVPADQSVTNIERKLVAHGATRIMKEYDGYGNVSAISFQKSLVGDQLVSFKLPANVDAVYTLFLKQKKGSQTQAAKSNLYQQAKRTAWKNVSDWVDIQMTLIALQQVQFTEVFLPYMLIGRDTVYQRFSRDNFKALAAASE
jgi:hypothetical protein